VRKRIALVAAALALLAAGCTTSAGGQPKPAPDGSSSGSSTPESTGSPSSSEPTAELPPRPKDISLDGLDPCTLYTDAQRAELKVDDVRTKVSDSEEFKGMKECVLSVNNDPYFDYSAMAVTTEGVEVWLSDGRNVDAELISVQGFPAAQFTFRGSDGEGCDIAIGVADNQYLWVDILPLDRVFEQDQLCQMVGEAADMAMTTLQTLR
jgi:hypothetical protein